MSPALQYETKQGTDIAIPRPASRLEGDGAALPGRAADLQLVVTLGLRGSASTWVFNVVRELMITAFGADSVAALFAASPQVLLGRRDVVGRHVVCKSYGWPDLDILAYLASARIIVTVRDPRDCLVSEMDRFGSAFAPALRVIESGCRYVAACAAAGHLVLRYEDRFFDDAATVRSLALQLGTLIGVADVAAIFDRYRTEAVRAFAAGVPSLPQERLDGDGKPLLFDRVTQITRAHIGDGRVGKWRERLNAQQRDEASRAFAAFLGRFGYAAE